MRHTALKMLILLLLKRCTSLEKSKQFI